MKNKEDVTSNGKLFNKFLLMFKSKNKGIKSKRQLLEGLPEEDDTSKAVNEVVQYVTNHPDEASEILQTILNKDEISNDVFKEASIELSKDDKVPNTAIVDAVKKSDVDVPYKMLSDMLDKGKFGTETTGLLIKQMNDKKVKQRIILNTLDDIYCKCDKYQSDEKLLEALGNIGINGKTKEQDTEVNMWIRKIISKRMANNFSKFGFSKIFVFSDYYSPEKMIEMDLPKDVISESEKLKTGDHVVKEEDVVDDILAAVATNVAKNYQETARYIIPQIKNLNNISEEEEEKFIQYIGLKSKRQLNESEISDIKKQVLGKARNTKKDEMIFNEFLGSGIVDLMVGLSKKDRDGAINVIKESLARSILKRQEKEKVEDDESDRKVENYESDRKVENHESDRKVENHESDR